MKKKKAFTLVEILIVVGIAGIIILAGVSPLMFTVRTLSDTRQAFTGAGRERAVFNRIVQDVREAAQLNAAMPVRVVQSEELAQASRDALIVWTVTPAYTGGPMGNVIYAIAGESVFSDPADAKVSGLNRWVISVDITPETNLPEMLEEEEAQLILPNLAGFAVQMLRKNSAWPDEEIEPENYTGGTPQAIRVTFEYEDDVERVYEAWFPNA